ncbi:MAG TPA: hypothetical protein VGC50_10880 [Gammaproteobacteria bacterium]|jgi:hypothetical protein
MLIRILCVAALAASLVIAESRAQMPVEPADWGTAWKWVNRW